MEAYIRSVYYICIDAAHYFKSDETFLYVIQYAGRKQWFRFLSNLLITDRNLF